MRRFLQGALAGAVLGAAALAGLLVARGTWRVGSSVPAVIATVVAEPDWEPRAPARAWRYIVIHHSGTASGSADAFDRYHREVRGWRSLGYHFVIGNGTGSPDGAVEVGPRWRDQAAGAHTGGTPGGEYNLRGIGICVVGDFTAAGPTAAQLASLERLCRFLAGRYGIPPRRIVGHRDAPGTNTDCPGDALAGYVHGSLRAALGRGAPAAP